MTFSYRSNLHKDIKKRSVEATLQNDTSKEMIRRQCAIHTLNNKLSPEESLKNANETIRFFNSYEDIIQAFQALCATPDDAFLIHFMVFSMRLGFCLAALNTAEILQKNSITNFSQYTDYLSIYKLTTALREKFLIKCSENTSRIFENRLRQLSLEYRNSLPSKSCALVTMLNDSLTRNIYTFHNTLFPTKKNKERNTSVIKRCEGCPFIIICSSYTCCPYKS